MLSWLNDAHDSKVAVRPGLESDVSRPSTQTRPSEQPGASAPSERPVKHLNQVELSRRWTISPRTLERWLGEGPRFLKIGGRVAYRLEDIEQYEQAQLREGASSNVSRA